jgi:hypothetical protein
VEHHFHDRVYQLIGGNSTKQLNADLNVPHGYLADFLNIIGESLNHNGKQFRQILHELVVAGGQEDHDATVGLSDIGELVLGLHNYDFNSLFKEFDSMH